MSVLREIERMTLKDKLRTMEALWDDLCRHEQRLPVPQWHKDILDERARLIQQGKARFIRWEVAKKQLSERTS